MGGGHGSSAVWTAWVPEGLTHSGGAPAVMGLSLPSLATSSSILRFVRRNSFILTRQRVLGNTIHCGPPAVLWCGSQQLTGAGVRVERDLIILTVQQGRGAVYSQNPLNHPVVNGEAEATRMMAGLLPRQEEQMAPL